MVPPAVRAQLPLVEAADQIQAVVHERDDGGFASVALEQEPPSVVLFWKGPLPEPVEHLVDQLQQKVAIDVRDAHYSRRELRDESNRIKDLGLPGLRITSVGPLGECSGLRVTVDKGNDLARAAREIKSRMRLEFEVQGPATAIPAGTVTAPRSAGRRPYASVGSPDSRRSADK
jgi:hypothetical protein